MEEVETGLYELPSSGCRPIRDESSYYNIAEKKQKAEVSGKNLQSGNTCAPSDPRRCRRAITTAFRVVVIALLTAIIVLVTAPTNSLTGLQGRSQINGKITESIMINQATTANPVPEHQCYNQDMSILCEDCSANERCIDGCNDKRFNMPACLADQEANCEVFQEYSNVHHYFTPPGDPVKSECGIAQFVTYAKKRADSGIRIQFNSNTNAHNGTAGCNRWYVKLNGRECTNPAAIEMVDYSTTPQMLSRNMEMDGICYGVPNGAVVVQIWIGTCAEFNSSIGLTGLFGVRQLSIMEILPVQIFKGSSYKPCPALAHFNFYYETWVQSGEATFDTSGKAIAIRATVYRKLASDSALRIKYQAVNSLLIDFPSILHYCVRWFVQINNTRCSPEGDFTLNSYEFHDHYLYHSRTRTLECICENSIPAGFVLVELFVEECYRDSQPDHIKFGDLNRPSRLFIEEVRLKKSTDAIVGTNEEVYRSVITNLASWQWFELNSLVDNGDILSVTYNKHYTGTALKLTSSGNHRIHGPGCARWFFKINGTECGNPGVIEAFSADLYQSNQHIPMQVTGHCYGLSSGTYNVTYSVGGCPDYAIGDSWTAHNAFNIFIEEVRLDHMKSCYGIPANCN